jgi:hypothetical protein
MINAISRKTPSKLAGHVDLHGKRKARMHAWRHTSGLGQEIE